MPKLDLHALQNDQFFKQRMKALSYNSHTDSYGLNIENKLNYKRLDIKKLDDTNFEDSKVLLAKHLEEVSQSTVDRYEAEYKVCLNHADEIIKTVDFNSIRLFKSSITFCPIGKLAEFFNEKIAPNFFQVFPEGKIYLIRVPTIYRSRAAFIRILYTLKNYPAIDKSKIEGFKTLRHWNIAEPQTIYRLVTSIILNINLPSVLGFMTDHMSLLDFVFVPKEPLDINYELGLLNILESDADFAQEDIDISEILVSDSTNLRHFFKNYLFDQNFSFNDTIDFLDWGLEASATLINTLFDVTKFLSNDGKNTVDPIYALEYLHSVVHMLRDICFILSTRSSYQSKTISFRVADILSSLANQGTLNKKEQEYFKELFKVKTRDELISIFDKSHSTTLKSLSTKTNELYDKMREIILDSVWIPGKKTTKGVLVGDHQELVDPDSFCTEVLRTLRNTHHGYFSRGAGTSNKTKYLSLIDGNVPDSLSSIAILWCLAFLESPERIVGKPSNN